MRVRPGGLPDRVYRVHHGLALLQDPYLNKGTAFTMQERDVLGLHGFLPPHVGTLEEQGARRMERLRRIETPILKYIFLRELQELNETLFYYICCQHMEEIMPLIYTPTVGQGCLEYSHIFWRPRGLFLGWPHRDRLDAILAHHCFDDIQVIVVTDGERILGLGDQGAGGMGIPIGKLALYTGCAGIHPRKTLPILLDVGTDNQKALTDPLYIGWCHQRLRGQTYYDFVDNFVQAVKRRWGNRTLLQWEDFARDNAITLLDRYKDEICSFNDDIQGTAAVVVSTILAAVQAINLPLHEARIVIRGAGSAATGIVDLIGHLLVDDQINADRDRDGDAKSQSTIAGDGDAARTVDRDGDGNQMTAEEEQLKAIECGRKACWMVNRNGLLLLDDPELEPLHKTYAHPNSDVADWVCADKEHPTLLEVIDNVKPHILIGVTGRAGVFDETIVRCMAKHVEKPIIMPLSNPTSCCEAQPQDLINWTEGRALVATGSPFPPVTLPDGSQRIVDQTNNVYVFPGLGLGVLSVCAQRVTHQLFVAAARTVAAESPYLKNPSAATKLLPPINTLRDVSRKVAVAVGNKAVERGLCAKLTPAQVEQMVADNIWEPAYHDYLSDNHYFIKSHKQHYEQGGFVDEQHDRLAAGRTASNVSSRSSSCSSLVEADSPPSPPSPRPELSAGAVPSPPGLLV